MNNGNAPANLNLPPPVPQGPELSKSLPEAELAAGQAAEAAPARAAAPEKAAAPPAIIPMPPMPKLTAVKSNASAASNTTSDNPATADDNDLIEKEWVLKAKQIVDKTREDPYIQNKELNVFKADYMQKRYNKTIKVSE